MDLAPHRHPRRKESQTTWQRHKADAKLHPHHLLSQRAAMSCSCVGHQQYQAETANLCSASEERLWQQGGFLPTGDNTHSWARLTDWTLWAGRTWWTLPQNRSAMSPLGAQSKKTHLEKATSFRTACVKHALILKTGRTGSSLPGHTSIPQPSWQQHGRYI